MSILALRSVPNLTPVPQLVLAPACFFPCGVGGASSLYAVREQGPGVKLQWVVSRGYSVQVARSDIITNFFRMFFGRI